MNITQEKTGDLTAILKIKIEPTDYAPRVDKAIKSQAKKANLPGFRKGMVPAAHIKKLYGKSILLDEVNNFLSESLNNYITDEKLQVLGQPLPVDNEVDFKWDGAETFEFDYEIGFAPEFELNIDSKQKFEAYKIVADEETLNSRIKNLRRSYGKMTNPEVSEDDDVLYVEAKQLATDGTVLEDGISKNVSLRTDLVKDEATKKSMLGLKKDSEIASFNFQTAYAGNATQIAQILNITPEDAEQLSSNFVLTVKNVNRLEEADLNQDFYDKLFGENTITNEEEFRARIKDELESMFALDADRKLQSDISNQVINDLHLELPDGFLRKWLKVSNQKLNETEIEKGFDDFIYSLKWTLIVNKIIAEQKIEVKYEDVFKTAKERLEAQFRMYSPTPISEEQLSEYTVQFLQDRENATRIFDEVRSLKVFDYIKSAATLDTKEISYEAFTALEA